MFKDNYNSLYSNKLPTVVKKAFMLKYVGNFYENKMSGQGTLFWTNGDIMKGTFKDDKFNGKGKLVATNKNN